MPNLNVRILRESAGRAALVSCIAVGAAAWLLEWLAEPEAPLGRFELAVYCLVSSCMLILARAGGRSVLISSEYIRIRGRPGLVDFAALASFAVGLVSSLVLAWQPQSTAAGSLSLVVLALLACHCMYMWSKMGRNAISIGRLARVRVEPARVRGKSAVTLISKDGAQDSVGLFQNGPRLSLIVRYLGMTGAIIDRIP